MVLVKYAENPCREFGIWVEASTIALDRDTIADDGGVRWL
jgi:hypothetical protein